jgi:hypothetical protein
MGSKWRGKIFALFLTATLLFPLFPMTALAAGNAGNTYVQQVSLDQTSLTLTAGGSSATLTATVTSQITTRSKLLNYLIDNILSNVLIWKSSNSQVASVFNGTVYPHKAGTAVITVTTVSGKSASCNVTVLPDTTPSARKSAVTVSDNGDETAQITMVIRNSSGEAITGLQAEDFVFDFEDGSSYTADSTVFSDFSESGNGVYSATYAPGAGVTSRTDLTVKDVVIRKDLEIKVAAKVYSVTVADVTNGEATVSVDPASAIAGDVVTVDIADIASGKQFGSISVTDADGNAVTVSTVTAGSEYTFTMPASDVTVAVTLVDTYAVTVEQTDDATVTTDVSTAVAGDTVTVNIADVASGMQFSAISVTDAAGNTVAVSEVTAGSEYTFTMPDGGVTVTVTFVDTYSVTVAQTDDATVTTNVSAAVAGATVTVNIADVASGKQVDSVSVATADGIEVMVLEATPGSVYTFTMPAGSVTVTVTFVDTYSVTIAQTDDATVTTDVSTAVAGDTVTVDITDVASGKLFSTISVTDASGNAVAVSEVTAGSVYTFTMPDSDVTVTVTISDIQIIIIGTHSVTVNSVDGATVTSSASSAASGNAITITVSDVASGKTVNSIVVTDASGNAVEVIQQSTTDNTWQYTFTMPDSDVTVTVTISDIQIIIIGAHNVTVDSVSDATVTTSASSAVAGNTVTITISDITSGKTVGSVAVTDASGNAVEVTQQSTTDSTRQYTFTMPDSDVTVTVTISDIQIIIISPYQITVSSTNGATVTADSTAYSGSTATVEISDIESGAVFDSIAVTDSSGNAVSTTEVTAGEKYTFTMPSSDVTVTVTLKYKISVSRTGTTSLNGEPATVTVTDLTTGEIGTYGYSDSANNQDLYAKAGDTIKVNATLPDDAMWVDSFTVEASDGTVLTALRDQLDTNQTGFTMVDDTVTVTVVINVSSQRVDS